MPPMAAIEAGSASARPTACTSLAVVQHRDAREPRGDRRDARRRPSARAALRRQLDRIRRAGPDRIVGQARMPRPSVRARRQRRLVPHAGPPAASITSSSRTTWSTPTPRVSSSRSAMCPTPTTTGAASISRTCSAPGHARLQLLIHPFWWRPQPATMRSKMYALADEHRRRCARDRHARAVGADGPAGGGGVSATRSGARAR